MSHGGFLSVTGRDRTKDRPAEISSASEGYVTYTDQNHDMYFYEPGMEKSKLVYSGLDLRYGQDIIADILLDRGPDEEHIYFIKHADPETGGTLYRMNIRTGETEQIDENVLYSNAATGHEYGCPATGFSYWKYDGENDRYVYTWYDSVSPCETEIVRERSPEQQ